MALRVTPTDNKPRPLDYYGLRVWVLYQNSAMKLSAKRRQIVAEMGLSEDEYDNLSSSEKDRIYGKSFIDTIVTGIDDCELVEVDDEGKESVIKFSFNAPSQLDGYATMGEEILGEDEGLREEILTRAVNTDFYREQREVRELGNSKAPSDSGG